MKSLDESRRHILESARNIKLLVLDCDGVLTDGRIIHGTNGFEAKAFSTKDGMGLTLWKLAGHRLACITGRTSEALTKRTSEIQFDVVHQGVAQKREVLQGIQSSFALSPEETAYIGDDVNDLPLLKVVKIFFCPSDAHDTVKDRSTLILECPGGKGAVREAVDFLLESQNIMESLIAKYTA